MTDEAIFYNSIAIAFESSYSRLEKARREYPDWKSAFEGLRMGENIPDPKKEWQKLQNLKIELVLFEDAAFPLLLKEIHDPPFGIYVRSNSGIMELCNGESLAI